MRYIYQVYQNQYALINNTINLSLQELQELNAVQKTLESAGAIKNKNALMSLGADFFINAKADKLDTVMVSIGGNYLVEKDIDSAKGFAAALIQKKTDLINKLVKNKRELESAMIDVSYKIDINNR